RVGAAARSLAAVDPDGRTLVVTHGGVVRVLRALSTSGDVVGAPWGDVGNASVWRVDVARA
ncbi:MAG: histidine phosphatase family protein, partial [Acidimicrobiales bacterium]